MTSPILESESAPPGPDEAHPASADLRDLALAQERFWQLHERHPGRAPDTVGALLRFSGRLDRAALRSALEAVGARHEAWRTTFHLVGGRPRRRLHPQALLELEEHDLTALPPAEREVRRAELVREVPRRPFDLARLPLVRLALLRLGPESHDLVVAFPHLVGDGWSLLQLLPGELQALLGGAALPPLASDYEAFLAWEREEHLGRRREEMLAFWHKHLERAPAALELPLDFPRPPAFDPAGARTFLRLPPDRAARLAELAKQAGAGLGDVLHAIWAVQLHRYSGAEDLVVGTPIRNRALPGTDQVFGCLLNTIPRRTDLSGDPSFLELVRRIHAERKAVEPHRTLALSTLLSALEARDASRHPVFQVAFNDLRLGPARFELGPGLELEVARIDTGRALVDLELSVSDAAEGLLLGLEWATRLFRAETAARILRHTSNLIDSALAAPGTAISRLGLISPEERQQLVVGWNDTAAPSPELLLHGPFEVQAAKRADSVALACQNRTMTFGQLEAAANRLARRLQQLGVKRKDLIGICLGRSFRMLEAMLGVLKAGGAYVPLDPAYPEDRLAFMLDDTQAPVVITERELAPRLPSGKAKLLVLEDEVEELKRQPATPPPCPSEVDDIAYIIYTSGSTGRPKGVVVRHRPAVNLTDWVNQTFAVGPDDRLLFVTSMNFDLSVYDTFGALGAGASVRVATSEELREPEKLVEYLASGEITFWDSAPPALVQLRPFFPLQPATKSRLRLVFNSGDWIPVPLPDQVRAAFPRARVISLGGATEATVWSNWFPIERVDPSWPSIPYGRPIRNARYYVLDKHFSPLPVGIPGELYIAGPCLADGYLNRPELNAEKFLPDPFVPGERMYRTGDLSRFFPDGNLEFLGRIDHQVKVRGFRIELGEIEAVLNAYPGVKGSLVIAPKDAAGERTLVGYVLHPEAGWDLAAVKAHAKGKLPEYMVPPHLVRLDSFPLTANGKVDRAALPAPERAREGDYVAPRGEIEEQLAGMWAEVLHLEQVGRKDDFFALGGHSLLATRVIGRIRERLGVSVPVRAMFDAGTLEKFARVVSEAVHASEEGPIEVDEPPGPDGPTGPLAPSQEVFWYQAQLDPSSTAYVIKAALRWEGPVTAAHLRAAVDEMVRRHEALRTAFVTVQGEPVQRVAPPMSVDMTEQDVGGTPDLEACARGALKELSQVPFDLASPPLIRGRILRHAAQDHVLLLVVHHIVSDGWSLWLIIEELTTILGALVAGKPAESALPALPASYRGYAHWYRRRMQGRRRDELLTWWGQRLKDVPPPLSIAEQRLLVAPPGRGSARILRQIPLDLSNAARKLGMQEGATPFMVLLAAFQLVLQRWSGREDVVVGTPVAGRERPEYEPLIGCFVNTTVLRTRVDPTGTFLGLLRGARETALGALAHADLPFPLLVRHLCPNRGREERNPLFEVFFNYLTPGRDHPEIPGVKADTLETQDVLHKFELTVYVHERPEGFLLDLVHDADRISPERASALAAEIEHVLRQAVEEPKKRLSELTLVAPGFRATVPDPAAPLDPARGLAIHQTFLQRALEQPNRVAVQDGRGRRWSYGELQARAEGIARQLVAAGLQPEDVVAVHAARSPALIAALLAILEAGGAWAILDPSYPGPRLARCLEVARPKALVLLDEAGPLDPVVQQALRGVAIRVTVPAEPAPARGAAGPALPRPDPDRLAYVAFTSGSTGLPKAVAGDHRPVAHFLGWQAQWFGLLDQDRFGLLAGLSHDPLLRDVFAPLSLGGTVCVPTEDARKDPATLLAFLREQQVSVVHLTPALAQLLSLAPNGQGALPALHLAFFGGDRLRGIDAARLRRVAPQVRCVNLYGTTETPQGMGFWEVDPELPDAAPAPIGRGIADVQLLILGSAGRCAPGELGEICVRTPYLTRGYLGDPAGTAERFVPGPARLGPWDRMYRTGDLGRYDPRGLVEFVGRGGDGQVQVRGYRVELGEVEAALLAQPGVTRALCRLDSGDERLVAWVAAPDTVKGHLLRQALRAALPEPMVPASIEVVESFPLTPNGKIDVARLPRPGAVMEETARKRVEPRTQTEAEIARVWTELLGKENLLVDDDFFQLGGHSLLAVRMLALLGERLGGVTLPVGLLMRAPRLGQLARALHDQAWVHEEPLVVPIQAGAPNKRPFWIVHPIGGHVVFAHKLAEHLDPERPMFGIQARGLDGHQPPFRVVEEMAAHYVKLLREVQPHGPYLLGGPSFGGTVAFEMAQQLLAAGERIGLLVLFDTFGPGYPDYKELPGRVADHLRHAFRLTWRERLDYVKERIQSRRTGRDLRWGKYNVAADAEAKGQLVDTVRGVVEANYAASTAYEERSYKGGKLHLFRAANRPAFPGKTFTDPTNGWYRVVEQGVEVVKVDCIHQTIMDEPAVSHVGRELDRLLKRL